MEACRILFCPFGGDKQWASSRYGVSKEDNTQKGDYVVQDNPEIWCVSG